VKTALKILVAERNRHVREFLRRELFADHHQVHLASRVADIHKAMRNHGPFDLVILDPDLPELESLFLIRKLLHQVKETPVILHPRSSSIDCSVLSGPRVSVVEKNGDSIERIERIISIIQAWTEPVEPLEHQHHNQLAGDQGDERSNH
jgi:DNA-binding NtrC family response regulator